MLKKHQLLFIFIICIISRLVTSVHYIADPDSLRFALAAKEFDIIKLQPHFPGYPVFCFFISILTALTSKFSMAFSIAGGLATYALAWSFVKLFKYKNIQMPLWLIGVLVLANPMVWIMSNRYMPDLTGAALVALFFVAFYKTETDQRSTFVAFILAGILCGVRLSYLPALVIPCVYLLIRSNERVKVAACFTVSVLIWLTPLIYKTGLENLVQAAQIQSSGHFNDWGGTIETESSLTSRINSVFNGILAHGFGFWWIGRNWITLLFSFSFVAVLLLTLKNKVSSISLSIRDKVTIASVSLYLIWVFLFQNIIYNPRHFLPVIIYLLFLFINFLSNQLQKSMFQKALVTLLLFTYAISGTALAVQQTKPTAIAQVAGYLKKQKPDVIYSTPLINFYLSKASVKSTFLNVEEEIQNKSGNTFVIGNFKLNDQWADSIKMFYHNPYVNSIWPIVPVKIYNNEK